MISSLKSELITNEPETPIDFVCLAKHRADPQSDGDYALAAHAGGIGYCARSAARNHEWVRVPMTPLGQITIGLKEERPPTSIAARGL